MATEKERGQEEQRFGSRRSQSVPVSESDVVQRNLHQQGTPDRLPAGSEMKPGLDERRPFDRGVSPEQTHPGEH